MTFNNKEVSFIVPLFSPVHVPVAQRFGPILSQIASSPTFRLGRERLDEQVRQHNKKRATAISKIDGAKDKKEDNDESYEVTLDDDFLKLYCYISLCVEVYQYLLCRSLSIMSFVSWMVYD